MKKWLAALIFSLVLVLGIGSTGALLAQDDLAQANIVPDKSPKLFTDLFLNGVFWQAATQRERELFVESFQEGLIIVLGEVQAEPGPDLSSGLSIVQLVDRITEFYQIAGTERIPLIAAYFYVNRANSGVSKEEMQNYLHKLFEKLQKSDQHATI